MMDIQEISEKINSKYILYSTEISNMFSSLELLDTSDLFELVFYRGTLVLVYGCFEKYFKTISDLYANFLIKNKIFTDNHLFQLHLSEKFSNISNSNKIISSFIESSNLDEYVSKYKIDEKEITFFSKSIEINFNTLKQISTILGIEKSIFLSWPKVPIDNLCNNRHELAHGDYRKDIEIEMALDKIKSILNEINRKAIINFMEAFKDNMINLLISYSN